MADGILPFLTVYLTVFNAPSPCKFCKARYILRLEYVSQMRVFLLGFLGVFSVTIYCKELFTVIWKEIITLQREFILRGYDCLQFHRWQLYIKKTSHLDMSKFYYCLIFYH